MNKQSHLLDFEEITLLDKDRVKKSLFNYSKTKIVKASMGSSQELQHFLIEIFPNINFTDEKKLINAIRIQEVEDIHREILLLIKRQK